MSDAGEIEWPREVWMAELDEHHNGTGMVVLSEFATVPRWEGDDERDCDFQRYVDGDIYDSAEKYWRERTESLAAENALLKARVAELEDVIIEVMGSMTMFLDDPSRMDDIPSCIRARAALKNKDASDD